MPVKLLRGRGSLPARYSSPVTATQQLCAPGGRGPSARCATIWEDQEPRALATMPLMPRRQDAGVRPSHTASPARGPFGFMKTQARGKARASHAAQPSPVLGQLRLGPCSGRGLQGAAVCGACWAAAGAWLRGRVPRRSPRFAPFPAQTRLAVTPQHAWLSWLAQRPRCGFKALGWKRKK